MMIKAALYTVDKKTRKFTREELGGYEEKQARRMSKVERVFDFMITKKDKHHAMAMLDIRKGISVYRIIE